MSTELSQHEIEHLYATAKRSTGNIYDDAFKVYNEHHDRKLGMGYAPCYRKVFEFVTGDQMNRVKVKIGKDTNVAMEEIIIWATIGFLWGLIFGWVLKCKKKKTKGIDELS